MRLLSYTKAAAPQHYTMLHVGVRATLTVMAGIKPAKTVSNGWITDTGL
jgi:hypothetical protein